MPQTELRGSRLRARFGSWWKARDLDLALATGADPLGSCELAFRARHLVRPRQRTSFARSIRKLVSKAEGPAPRILPGPEPFARHQLRANRMLLIELAERLEDGGLHCLRGLAAVDMLLQNRRSPLNLARPPKELELELRSALSALDPLR